MLIAKSDLDTGQVVGANDVGWQTWPAASTGSNFIRKTDRPDAIKDFVGAIVRTPVAAGEPIRDSKVVASKAGGFMAAVLPRRHARDFDGCGAGYWRRRLYPAE